MKKDKMKIEYVYSEIFDKNFSNNLKNNKVWENCYHKEDKPSNFSGYEYKVGFQGLTPVQVMGLKKIAQ